MNSILRNWNIVRIIRLLVGVAIAIYALVENDYVFLWLAGIFLLQALLNMSCCGTAGCSTSSQDSKKRVYEGQIKEYKNE